MKKPNVLFAQASTKRRKSMGYECDVLRLHAWVTVPSEHMSLLMDEINELCCRVRARPERLIDEINGFLMSCPEPVRNKSRLTLRMSKVKAKTLRQPRSACYWIMIPGDTVLIRVRMPLLSSQAAQDKAPVSTGDDQHDPFVLDESEMLIAA